MIAHAPPAAVMALHQLRLGYGHRTLGQQLSFEIRRGDVLGIVGPNGCGKTTLLRTMLGLARPLAGRVERSPDLKISYVPQRERLDTILPFTALDVASMSRAARGGARAVEQDAARAALERVGAGGLSGQLYRQLSGGQQQRVLLARAIAAEPDVLVLDEPTSGMDVANEAAILQVLRDLNRGQVTILIVTHSLSVVLNFATTMMLMGPDRVLYGAAEDVLDESRLSALYEIPITLGRVGGQRTVTASRGGGDSV